MTDSVRLIPGQIWLALMVCPWNINLKVLSELLECENDSKNGIWSFAIIANSQNPLQKKIAKVPILKQNTFAFLFLAQNLDPIFVSEIYLSFGPADYFVLTSGEWLQKDSIRIIFFQKTMRWDLSHSVVMLNGLINFKSR